MNDHDPLLEPDYRATATRGRLTIVQWHPRLVDAGGPSAARLRACGRAGVGIADLTVIRDAGLPLDVIVSFLCGGHRPGVRDSLVRWATLLGYRRVWFPDGIVDLGGARLLAGGVARTRCPTCRTRWEDGDPEFWLWVRRYGLFPTACQFCGGDLPQWEVVDAPSVSQQDRAQRGASDD